MRPSGTTHPQRPRGTRDWRMLFPWVPSRVKRKSNGRQTGALRTKVNKNKREEPWEAYLYRPVPWSSRSLVDDWSQKYFIFVANQSPAYTAVLLWSSFMSVLTSKLFTVLVQLVEERFLERSFGEERRRNNRKTSCRNKFELRKVTLHLNG